MRRLRLMMIAGVIAVALPALAPGATSTVSLKPDGYGWRTFAGWRPNQGEQDTYTRGRMALLFQKGLTSTHYAAAIADVNGLRGQKVKTFTQPAAPLAWDRRNDGHCGLGAPRWDLDITGASGERYVVYLACGYAAHSQGVEANWTKDTFTGAAIRNEVLQQAGADALAGTVRGLGIVFDEGADSPSVVGAPGSVYLDTIRVGPRVWRSPYD
jgi:hypothetical protein